MDDYESAKLRPCPECGHLRGGHNDAGTIRGGQGEMRCYHPLEGTQFLPSGEPNVCGCRWSGYGTVRYYSEVTAC